MGDSSPGGPDSASRPDSPHFLRSLAVSIAAAALVAASSEKVASSHRPIHRIDADGRETKKLRGNVQVAGELAEDADVIDMGSAVLDP